MKSLIGCIVQAVEHYTMAAADGHTKALYNLAVLYLRGEHGVHRDPEAALKLLDKAAQQGLKQVHKQPQWSLWEYHIQTWAKGLHILMKTHNQLESVTDIG